VVSLKVAGAGVVVLGVVRAGVVLEVPVGDVMGLKVVGRGHKLNNNRLRGGVGAVVASLQADAPTTEYLPAGQKGQETSEFAPIIEEYLPARQFEQLKAPDVEEYLPGLGARWTDAAPVARAFAADGSIAQNPGDCVTVLTVIDGTHFPVPVKGGEQTRREMKGTRKARVCTRARNLVSDEVATTLARKCQSAQTAGSRPFKFLCGR
jgi:hypothetical protein